MRRFESTCRQERRLNPPSLANHLASYGGTSPRSLANHLASYGGTSCVGPAAADDAESQIRHDNTFGTPEEDAFRRDFTINALFYDIAGYSIIDYVGGLQDLKDGLIRCIGDPNERFQEDPVRMLRAIVMASRLNFRLDPPIVDAIKRHRSLIATSSPARLIEEY